MRVLVVEDDADLSRQLAEALRQAGYVVDTAADGEDGHYLGDTEPYDVVVLDIGLPVMDGYELARRMRALHARPPTFIAISGSGRDGERQRSLDAGFTDLLVKPVGPGRLEHAVARALEPEPSASDERAG